MNLKFDTKSIVQILLLVVLLVGGIGVWLSQREGGLSFLGGDSAEHETPVAVAPKPTMATDPLPTIPAQPANGQIQSVGFTVDAAEIEGGVLTLRQGVEPADTQVKLFLRTKPWEVPAGRSFQLINANAQDAPLIRIRWYEPGQNAPRQREFKEKYTLRLELGPERNRKVDGKIYLTLPDENKSQVAGTFTADVRGFRLVDGKPDLTSDSVDTLQYLALRELLRDDADKPIKDVTFRQARYAATGGVPASGYLELDYTLGTEPPATQKFQFVKEDNTWRVVGKLNPDQLDEAHPHHVPGPKDAPERVFPYLAAKRIETDLQKRAPGRLVSATEFTTRYSDKHKIGVSEVSYKVGDGQLVQTAFLYRKVDNGWTLARELNKKERVNLASGKVETQR
ncbi:MAG: hypothetical protein HY308_15850 [Gammaproteobacteria bacterium]|nr:hypothetical protein [Gammaproteobacteria bacterium]